MSCGMLYLAFALFYHRLGVQYKKNKTISYFQYKPKQVFKNTMSVTKYTALSLCSFTSLVMVHNLMQNYQ